MHNGLLYSQGRILVPPTAAALILKIMQQYHDSPLAGHYGVARTQALVEQYFQWSGTSAVATPVSATKSSDMRFSAFFPLFLFLPVPGCPCP